jgi:ubiquinol-cytochrome c reductase cytochrome c1 subunit
MPHVLWELQGQRRPIYQAVEQHGHTIQVVKGWEQITPGKMTAVEYDAAIGDLVNYLQWMAEPAQNTRVQIGVWIMLFLLIFMVIAWRLNASYWKDIR